MTQTEQLFVFSGPAGISAAEIFAMMDKVQVTQTGRKAARIVVLGSEPKTTVNLVDFTLDPILGVLHHDEKAPLMLHAPETAVINIVYIEDSQFIASLPINERFEITQTLDKEDEGNPTEESPINISLMDYKQIVPTLSADVNTALKDGAWGTNTDETELPITSKTHVTQIPLLPLKNNQKRKPRNGILTYTSLYGASGSENWVNSEYIDPKLFRRISKMITTEPALSLAFEDYDAALDILAFFGSVNKQVREADIVRQYNLLVCNHETTQIALKIAATDLDDVLPVAASLNTKSLQNAAVFVPLLYKKDLTVIRGKVGSENYKVIFYPPFLSQKKLVEAVRNDMATRHCIVFYHELNRKMLTEGIFGGAPDLLFYTSKTFLDDIQQVSKTNQQAYLERKERYYAKHLNAQMLRCIALVGAGSRMQTSLSSPAT